jgi:NAD(P)-dependent dehydrogenase (short-subunit alcohol dehydrogenase family)
MDTKDARVLVVGASGALGGELARRLHENGARVVAAGRDPERTRAVAEDVGTDPLTLDVVDVEACAATVAAAVEQLGGLDLLLVTVGVAAFGKAAELDEAVAEELYAVDVLGPVALVRAAVPHLRESSGTVAVISAVLADLPTSGMADYSAAKAALATWLQVLRREERRSLKVLDVRPPHLDTGLETRALAGEPPRLPAGRPAGEVVDLVLQALAEDKQELVVDGKEMVLR